MDYMRFEWRYGDTLRLDPWMRGKVLRAGFQQFLGAGILDYSGLLRQTALYQ